MSEQNIAILYFIKSINILFLLLHTLNYNLIIFTMYFEPKIRYQPSEDTTVVKQYGLQVKINDIDPSIF